MQWRPAAALLALAVLPALCACSSIRGLDPALAARYQPTADGKFTCLDGKKSVPFSQVNDDYCDCLDGSDEPGTSACASGKFYCANKFYLPLVLNASMVDDGVCDCCDGSDEPAGRCPDNCYEKGYESLISLKEQVATADAGAQARDKYIQEAGASKQKWEERKAAVDVEVEQRRKEKEEADAAKSKLEEEQRKLRDRKRELEEQQKQRQEELKKAQGAEQGAAVEEQQPEEQAGGEEEAGEAADTEQAQGDGQEEEKSAEELAKERMAQWIPGAKDGDGGAEAEGEGEAEEEAAAFEEGQEEPPVPAYDGEDLAAGEQDGLAEQDESEEFFREQVAAGAHAGTDGTADDGGSGAGAEEQEESDEAPAAPAERAPGAVQPTSTLGKAKLLLRKVVQAITGDKSGAGSGLPDDELAASIAALDSEISALETKLSPARTKASDARSTLNELEREQRNLQQKLDGSYGESDVFVALVDRCFEAKVDKYSYEVCPFDKASQKEGHSSTSLGSWSGLEENFTKMCFTNGQACWQGPARSMTVTLRCGQTERLAKVEEPSRCEYTAELETPAACTPAAAEMLKKELAARQRFLESGGEDDPGLGLQKDEL